jgi:Transposase DDE domain
MPSQSELDCWIDEVSTTFCSLSRPQARVLALYSYGMALVCHSGLTTVSYFLALLLGRQWEAVRRQLREWTYEAAAKRGAKRQSVQVALLFAPLLKWVMRNWQHKNQLILALDVTYLRQRHTILSVSVVYGGSAIPVAWRVMRGETKGAWHPQWVELLRLLAPGVARGCQVWVLCDEGLYSQRLFKQICQHGWHPVMRIRTQGLYRRRNGQRWRSLETVAQRGMRPKAFRGQCFKGETLNATLWVQWGAVYEQPCLLVTDLAPKHLKRHIYGLRHWIECGFKALKRGGLHWEQSKTPCPERMERLLLVMALAMGWLMAQGVACSETPAASCVPLSLMRRGWIAMVVAAIRQQATAFAFWPPYTLPPFPV